MAHPFRNVGKCGTSPVTQNEPSTPGEEIVDWPVGQELTGGSAPGMFAIPLGIYNRYKDYQKKVRSQGPKTTFDPAKVKAMKYEEKKTQ